MSTEADYKTLKDGSIDYTHYIERGREIRSNQAYTITSIVMNSLKALLIAEPKVGLLPQHAPCGNRQAAG